MRTRAYWRDLLWLLGFIALVTTLLTPDYLVGGAHPRVRPPGLEPCWASLQGDQVRLRFFNPSNRQVVLQVGEGSPALRVSQQDLLVFEPNFRCKIASEHDDFHATSLVMEPGARRELSFPIGSVEGLDNLLGAGEAGPSGQLHLS